MCQKASIRSAVWSTATLSKGLTNATIVGIEIKVSAVYLGFILQFP
jgi:hypothetical protein